MFFVHYATASFICWQCAGSNHPHVNTCQVQLYFTWINSWTKPDKICNSLPRKREASKSRLTKWATQKRNAPKKEEKINEKFKQVGGELMMGDKLMMNNNHTVGLGKESRG